MSWQVAIFVGLGVVLVGGFAWYERSRPPARLVALVAALAALAVAGRLGPGPDPERRRDHRHRADHRLRARRRSRLRRRRARGADLEHLARSGPVDAVADGGLGAGRARRRAAARPPGAGARALGLAIACGIAGLAYGALLDLSVMVTYGGEQSLDRYLALSARGIPFNVAHAAGNVAFALAAGPALVRMISRYRTRFEFTWRPGPRAAGALALALAIATWGLASSGPAAGAPGESRGCEVGAGVPGAKPGRRRRLRRLARATARARR